MATIDDLDGAFKSLTDTLQNLLSPFFSQPVSLAWLGAIGHSSAIGRDTIAWNALPSDLDQGDPIVSALDHASRQLASASTREDEAILDALRAVEVALSTLDALLRREDEL